MGLFRELFRPGSGANGTGRCLIIAEVAQAHDGSLGLAHSFIDAIAESGADAVKFQTHIAAAESTPGEPWRVRFSMQDSTRYEYWRRMEFTESQWLGLKRHAEDRGLLFLSSPFSVEAVHLLSRIGVRGWKIASGELSNRPMLESVLETRLPVILSTGMSPWEEIDEVVDAVRAGGVPLAVLQCTTAYPTPPERVGLNLLPVLRERYRCAVGLSDHSGTIYPGLAAATSGADVLEIHVTLTRQMFGPDVSASVTPRELRTLVEGIRFIEKMIDAPVDKDAMALEMAPLREVFTRSVVLRRALPAGSVLTRDDLAAKKPGVGIPATRLHEMIGARLTRAIPADVPLRLEDLELAT